MFEQSMTVNTGVTNDLDDGPGLCKHRALINGIRVTCVYLLFNDKLEAV